jgi:hypothetical protein
MHLAGSLEYQSAVVPSREIMNLWGSMSPWYFGCGDTLYCGG